MIDWTNPTVQGAVVAATTSLIGVVIAAIAGVSGAIVGARIAASAIRREGELSRQADAAARVREWNLRRIADTRRQLVAIADAFLALMSKDLSTAGRLLRQVNDPLLANARLVGDLEPLSQMARAVVGSSSVLQGNALLRAVRLATTNPFSDAQRAAMQDARAAILTALERQEERALRDEDLVVLTPDQVATIPEFRRASESIESISDEANPEVAMTDA